MAKCSRAHSRPALLPVLPSLGYGQRGRVQPVLCTGVWLGATGQGRGREGLTAWLLACQQECFSALCFPPNILCPWLMAIGYRQFLLGVKVWSLWLSTGPCCPRHPQHNNDHLPRASLCDTWPRVLKMCLSTPASSWKNHHRPHYRGCGCRDLAQATQLV